MAKFRRKGPHCIAPESAPGREIEQCKGDDCSHKKCTVEASLSTGWADDPDWEWVDRPVTEETEDD